MTCRKTLRASLEAAVARVLAQQHVNSVQELTYDKHIDDIRSTTAGVVGVRPIDWQNRRPSSRSSPTRGTARGAERVGSW